MFVPMEALAIACFVLFLVGVPAGTVLVLALFLVCWQTVKGAAWLLYQTLWCMWWVLTLPLRLFGVLR